MNKYIDEAKQIASEKGGKLITIEIKTASDKLEFECKRKHKYIAKISTVRGTQLKKGSWCKICFYIDRRFKADDIYEAINGKGKCLTNLDNIDVNTNKFRAEFECNCGYRWTVRVSNILSGTWCQECAHKEKCINYVGTKNSIMKNIILQTRKIIIKNNLEYKKTYDEYAYIISNRDRHMIKTKKDTLNINAYYDEFIRIIENKNKDINIPINIKLSQQITQILEKSAINCLTDYGFEENKYNLFKCKIGHMFIASTKHIINKKNDRNICFKCCRTTEENICASVFEYIFETEFIKIRPEWLDDNEGNRLELDGYNEELKIAFEYNGPQHYMHIHNMTDTLQSLLKVRKNDLIKMRKCKMMNIKLIVIPYWVKINDMYNYIINQCIANNINIINGKEINNIDLLKHNNTNSRIYNNLTKICKKFNVTCLNIQCIKSERILTLKCNKNHVFTKRTKHINIQSTANLCNTCSQAKIIYDKCEAIVTKKKGILMSTIDNITDKFIKIKCSSGHIFFIEYRLLCRGQFCKLCKKCIIINKMDINNNHE